MRQQQRRWQLHQRSGQTLADLAQTINVVIRGWIGYYGRFRVLALVGVFRHLNDHLVRWAMRKYKRLHRSYRQARRSLAGVARREPGLFAHWELVRPSGR